LGLGGSFWKCGELALQCWATTNKMCRVLGLPYFFIECVLGSLTDVFAGESFGGQTRRGVGGGRELPPGGGLRPNNLTRRPKAYAIMAEVLSITGRLPYYWRGRTCGTPREK
jgi:hypothetical protein